MAAPWQDETLGAFGSASQIPDNTWFPVNPQTGEWGTPTPTLARDAGIPDIIPTRTMAPVPAMGGGFGGQPDQAPLSIGQASGTMAPPMTMPRSMQRVQRLDEMGALTRQPGMWETIARGVGMLSPQGSAILQASDQQQQQQLQNRLTMRRQALQEAQNERAEIRDDFNSLLKLSEIKSKKLRNLYTDRFIADMQSRGKILPPDFVEAFKTSSGDEAKAMVKFYEPLLTDLGLDPTAFAELVDQGGIKEVGEALTLAQKLKKDKTEQARLAALDKIADGTLGDASGATAPATPGTSLTGPAVTPRGYADGGATQPIVGIEKLTPTFTTKAHEVAGRLGMNPQDLLRIISFETGGTFDPAVKNRAGSGATGLIQFMPETAKALGTTTEALAKMTPEQQLDYVEKYLTPHKGKLGNIKDAYLAVLKPSALGGKATDPLFTQEGDPTAYRQNAGLDKSGKGVVTVGDAVDAVMRTTGAAGGGTAPTTAGQPTAPTGGTPQEQAQLQAYNTRIATLEKNIARATQIGGEEGRARATAWERQRDNLAQERDRLRTRMLEPTRAAERLEASKQTGAAAAERQLEVEMNKPIGTENAIKMNLPPQTRWKDVPKDVRVLDRPGEGVTTKLGDYKASHEGITRVIGMLDKPGAKSIIGTLLSSEDNAAFRRAAGAWISSVTPAERKFAAALVAEIAGIRNTISGQAVSKDEAEFLKPMLPSVADPDIETVRAKLEVLQEWIARKHEGARTQMDELGFRSPKPLPKPAEPAPKDPKEKLLEKYTR